MKQITIILLLSTLSLFGCKERSEVIRVTSNKAQFDQGYIKPMPTLRNSEKRGFADFTCDGVEDMIEINDEKFFGQEYKINLFEGYLDENNQVQFKSKRVVDLGIQLNNWSSQTKMDTADINGDGCADVVFSDISTSWRDVHVRLEVAMNLGDMRFSTRTTPVKMDKGAEFTYWFKELVKDISLSEDESLSDYVKMDWEDWDGNGSDDFMIFVDDNNSLDMAVFLTEKTYKLIPHFVAQENIWSQNFMFGLRANHIDVADVTGDGHADILVYKSNTSKDGYYYERYALAVYNDGELSIERDKTLRVKADLDFFSKASKRDITDMTGDGKSDIVYVTESNDQPIMLVWESM